MRRLLYNYEIKNTPEICVGHIIYDNSYRFWYFVKYYFLHESMYVSKKKSHTKCNIHFGIIYHPCFNKSSKAPHEVLFFHVLPMKHHFLKSSNCHFSFETQGVYYYPIKKRIEWMLRQLLCTHHQKGSIMS